MKSERVRYRKRVREVDSWGRLPMLRFLWLIGSLKRRCCMQERTLFWQAVGALLISLIVLAVVGTTAWFTHRVDDVLLGSSPPLPSGITFLSSLILAVLAGLAAVVSGAVALIGIKQAKYFTRQFAWVVYVVVALPLTLVLLTPLQRGGHSAFLGLPSWLLAVEGRAVIGVALGALFLGSLDLRRIVPRLVLESARPVARVSTSPTAVRGLPGRFTPNAWRALSFMQEEAQRFEHAYMGTEHLLLGLLRDTRSQATRVLINLGGEPSGIKTQLEGVIGRRGSLFTGGTGMTRRCQRVIEGGARIARASGQRTVGTGHLLQALVETPEDVAGQLLDGLGVTADRVSAELRHLGPESD